MIEKKCKLILMSLRANNRHSEANNRHSEAKPKNLIILSNIMRCFAPLSMTLHVIARLNAVKPKQSHYFVKHNAMLRYAQHDATCHCEAERSEAEAISYIKTFQQQIAYPTGTLICKAHSSPTSDLSVVTLPRNDMRGINLNNMCKSAFSLIEAMIVLLLISIAVMALIPLVTKQSTPLGWKTHMDNSGAIEYLYFGDKSNNRLGIGTGVDPYDANARGKVVTDSAWIGETKEIFKPNMLGGDVCSSGTKNNDGIFIRSQSHATNSAPTACTANNIQINNLNKSALSWVKANAESGDTLTIKSGDQSVISVTTGDNGENQFLIYTPSGTNVLSYMIQTLSTGANTVVNIGNGGTGTLTINASALTADTFWIPADDGCISVSAPTKTCNPSYYRSVADCNNKTNAVTCSGTHWICPNSSNIITYDDTDVSECTAASNTANKDTGLVYEPIISPSDKRLKNVISNYTKGIDDVSQLKTYNFTYKNDKKQKNFVGLIAQKLQGLFDEAIHSDEKGYLSYEKTPILYAMVNSVKDIFSRQHKVVVKQAKLNKKADKLLEKYEK